MVMFTLWRYSRSWALNINNMIEKFYRYGTKKDISDVDKEILTANNALANLEGIKNRCSFPGKFFCNMCIKTVNNTLRLLEDLRTFLETING